MKKPAYSAALDRVLFRASRLARELGGAQTGTEHLLLALSQERISQTGRILCYQGAEGRLLRCMLLTRQEPEPAGRQGLSAAAARALDGAQHEADRLARPSACRSICCFPSCATTPMRRRACFRSLASTATAYFRKHMTACASYIRRRT